ncbi:uncharacterized protein ccdc66 isoform X2 [Festucalex cinctus]
MYLGDGLLFELQNGKPKLIVLNHGAERNLVKNSLRPRPTYVLNSKQPTRAEDVRAPRTAGQRPGAARRAKAHPAEIGASFGSGGATVRIPGSQAAASKTRERRTAPPAAETVSKVKSECRKSSCPPANRTSAQAERWAETSGVKSRTEDSGEAGPTRDAAARLSAEHALRHVRTSSHDQNFAEKHAVSGQLVLHAEEEVEIRGETEEDRVGCDVTTTTTTTTTNGISPLKDNRCPGGLFGWLEQRHVDARASAEAKKAQWRQQLNEQVALKQQHCSNSHRQQADEKAASASSTAPAACHREQPAAIRSSLRLGAVTPMEDEALAWERREEQRRLWLEDLDRQREETSHRRRQEKMLRSQKEDHELWAAHFDSLQRKPPTGAPLAPSGDWEASSSLSLAWDASSSCGAESAGRASADAGADAGGRRYPTRSSYLRSMTALLDPVQMEERQMRRLKQLQQQRDIRAQVEERRRRRQEEEASRRKEEEEEERRIAMERELLRRRCQDDGRKHREERKADADGDAAGGVKESADVRASRPAGTVETREAAVQTAPPPVMAECPPTAHSSRTRAGKENARGGGAYEAFARTETRKEKRRPEWNTHRPSRRSGPASEQRSRRESRPQRQEEVVALQHRKANPQEARAHATRPPSHKEDCERVSVSAKRGRSPALQFIPYVRTDDVVRLETTNQPAPHNAWSRAPPPNASSPADSLLAPGKQRQQEILRGLAQLRQALLEKKREVDEDMRRRANDDFMRPSEC